MSGRGKARVTARHVEVNPNRPHSTFSSTVSRSTRLNSWKIMPMRRRVRRIARRSSDVTSVPSSTTDPSSGSTSRLMHLRSVDFPEPLNPRIATTCLAPTETSTPSSARSPVG